MIKGNRIFITRIKIQSAKETSKVSFLFVKLYQDFEKRHSEYKKDGQ